MREGEKDQPHHVNGTMDFSTYHPWFWGMAQDFTGHMDHTQLVLDVPLQGLSRSLTPSYAHTSCVRLRLKSLLTMALLL